MELNTHSYSKREEWGHGKEILDQSKAKNQQGKNPVQQLYAQLLGLYFP